MHGLEIGSAGQVAFATRGEPGWHNLGTVFPDDRKITTAEMLDLAHLSGWSIELIELQTKARARKAQPFFEVVRTNPFDGGLDRLGVVKSRYRVFQNEELFAFGDNILSGGAQWETGGSIKDGTQVFGSLLIDRTVVLGAGEYDDSVKIYLLVSTSHDGTLSIQASVTPVRVVCQNTLGVALSGVQQKFKIRHTEKADGKVAEAQKALGLTFAYAAEFEKEMEALIQQSITDNEFDALVKGLYPEPEKDVKGSLKKWETKRDLLWDVYRGQADGPDTMSTITGTKYGALNALTEALDWYRMPRSGNVDNLFIAQAGFDPAIAEQKDQILAAVKSL
jgi:phage/plasmid-like protein (TIGR03299 family)